MCMVSGQPFDVLGSSGLTYDADGQLTSFGSTTYTWNAENRLSQITRTGPRSTRTRMTRLGGASR
ncbi:MAG: hypothetical protein K6T81_19625 [Alicyclobacillus macrosporangiidus]|nr:hypothetical protein [Alicyclobacillus macrosporangiidus]